LIIIIILPEKNFEDKLERDYVSSNEEGLTRVKSTYQICKFIFRIFPGGLFRGGIFTGGYFLTLFLSHGNNFLIY